MDLSVVIVNWNAGAWLTDCLDSIFDATHGISYEVLVIDNASTDDSAALVTIRFPDVVLTRNDENLGFARASNQGIRKSCGRYVMLLNPDTQVVGNALAEMVAFADAHPNIGALGCRILTSEGEIDYRCARRLPSLLTEFFARTRLAKRFPNHRLFGRFLIGDWDHKSSREVDCLVGACMLVRRDTVAEVGPLDETFFMYGEDLEWCSRIRDHGWTVFYYSQPCIVHFGAKSAEQNQHDMGIEYLRSMDLFFRKHYGPLYALTYRAMLTLMSLAKHLLFSAGNRLTTEPENRQHYREKVRIQRRVLRWLISG